MKELNLLWNSVRIGASKVLCTVLVCGAAFGWWGVLYPQFALNRDTYRIVSEDGTVQEGEDMVEWEAGDTVYMEILNADSSRIRFRSKFLMDVAALWERLSRE